MIAHIVTLQEWLHTSSYYRNDCTHRHIIGMITHIVTLHEWLHTLSHYRNDCTHCHITWMIAHIVTLHEWLHTLSHYRNDCTNSHVYLVLDIHTEERRIAKHHSTAHGQFRFVAQLSYHWSEFDFWKNFTICNVMEWVNNTASEFYKPHPNRN